ncbi:MAG: TonB-dependent receptor [Nitrospira sp.]
MTVTRSKPACLRTINSVPTARVVVSPPSTMNGWSRNGGYQLTLPPNAISVDPYQRVDAMLFYRGHKRYDVTVNVRNLLNARYIESPGNLQSFNGFGAPITAIASLRVFF